MAEDTSKNRKDREEEFNIYITKIYRVIPKNCALIVRNKFNGQRVKVKTGGFAFVAPWSEAKLVSLAIRNIDYEKLEFDEKEGQQVKVDLALSVRVVDPIKYEYAHQNIEQELKVRIYSAVRVLIKKASFEELSKKHFELPKNDISMSPQFRRVGGNYYYRDSLWKDNEGKWHGDEISDFDIELFSIRRELNDFAEEFGLEVVSLRNKEVQQSEEMQKVYDELVRKRREGQASLEAAELDRQKAKKDAERIKIEQDAYNYKYVSFLNSLKAAGLTDSEIQNQLHAYIIANGQGGIANETAATATAVAAGLNAANQANRQKTR